MLQVEIKGENQLVSGPGGDLIGGWFAVGVSHVSAFFELDSVENNSRRAANDERAIAFSALVSVRASSAVSTADSSSDALKSTKYL